MDRDYKNEPVLDTRWRRLKKYQKEVLHLRYAALEEEVKRLCIALSLPDACAQNAVELAKQLVGRGYSLHALAAAALIMACRMLKMPRPINEFVDFVDNIEKVKKILREMSALWKTPPRLEHYVAIIAMRANVPSAVVRSAVELLQKNRKVLQGRNPWAVAAAALWLSGVNMSVLRQFASPSAIKIIARLLK